MQYDVGTGGTALPEIIASAIIGPGCIVVYIRYVNAFEGLVLPVESLHRVAPAGVQPE